jgi:hypothetical protein
MLLARGLTHKYVTFSCFFLNISFVVLAYLGRHLGPTYLFASMGLISFMLLGLVIYFKKPVKNIIFTKQYRQSNESALSSGTKVVPLNMEAAVAEN